MQTYTGIFHNGAIVLNTPSDFIEGDQLTFCVTENKPAEKPPEEMTFEELDELFSCMKLDTRGWKFNREEANAR